jgi:xyloglucan-specific exo-beta-1,4-glucanase
MKKVTLRAGLFVLFSLLAICALSFRPTGGTIQAASGETYTWKNVQICGGGFVPGIIFNTKQKNLIYARTDIGGAYRWDPDNSCWIPLNDWVGFADWNKNGVDALATDPVEPNRVYMAVGTYTNDWDTNGFILRSTDKGATWESSALSFKVGGNMPGRSMGERLVIDPNKNNILFFGARSGNGLWKSTDYGVTWSKVTSFTNTGTYIQNPGEEYGGDAIGIAWITFDPSTTGSSGSATQTIYVGVADTGNSIYRSTDGGATWAAVSGQPTGYLPHHGALSSTGILYITYSNGCGPYDGTKGEVWKYDTKTSTWTPISPVASSSSDDYYGYGGLAVDAQHPNTIMVATLNAWWPDAIIFRSTDAGATWTRIWDWNGYPDRTLRYTQDITAAPWLTFGVSANPPVPSPKLGWMIGDLEIDPFNSDRMMYGTGATIYGTTNLTNWDNGGTVKISVMAKGIEETAVCCLISPPAGAHLLSGLGDIGGFRHDDLTTVPSMLYTQPIFVTTTCMDYAENNPSYMVRVGNVDRTYTSNLACGFSYDGGADWFSTSVEPSGTTNGGMVAVAADGSVVLWSPSGTSAVYYTKNNGSSWTACSGLPAQALIISDRVNAKKFYGFKSGTFYVSTDAGATFTATAATGLPESGVCSFKAMPGVEGDIWFAGGSTSDGVYGLWHSTDSGAGFTKLTDVQQADCIGFGKAASGKTYMTLFTTAKINDVRGIYRSTDAGATWIRINDDAHQYACLNMCITGDPRIYGRVYVGTNGRGIVYGDTSDITTTVAAPTFSPAAGTYSTAQSVTISSATSGATIYYTTDGSTPTSSSTVYSGPITVSSTTMIKAYAAASGMTDSSVASATYTISSTQQVATPTFSPTAGIYSAAQNVAISSATSGATIYYTTDGSTPTSSSTVYSGAITVSKTATIKAIAVSSGMINSEVASATYTIASSYVVTYTITNDWGTGAIINVTITNNSGAALSSWTLAWTFPGDQTITNLWNGNLSQSGISVTVSNKDYNGTIAANGGTVSFGFQLSYSGSNAKPTGFTLNGTSCQIQ